MNSKAPGGRALEALRKQGLVVDTNLDGSSLSFCATWTQARIDVWVRSLFPKVFTWLDKVFPLTSDGKTHWRLGGKSYQSMYLFEREEITGNELRKARGSAARAGRDYVLHIGTSATNVACLQTETYVR
jgi:hypothetical protein